MSKKIKYRIENDDDAKLHKVKKFNSKMEKHKNVLIDIANKTIDNYEIEDSDDYMEYAFVNKSKK
jgi:predicted secreted acid phosphatase